MFIVFSPYHQTDFVQPIISQATLNLCLSFMMSESSQGTSPTNKSSNMIKMLEYRITRRADLSLAFEPPAGSRELANALSMKYPLCENLEQQLQSALLDFINTEQDECHKNTLNPFETRPQSLSSETPLNTIKSSSPKISSPKNSFKTPDSKVAQTEFQSSMLVWNITTGKPVEKKRNRIKYDTDKRVKVAGVRKFGACDFHRKKKTECTCNTSPISQKSPATQRRPSLTSSTNRSIDEQSLDLKCTKLSPRERLDSTASNEHFTLSSDASLFHANLPQLSDADFDSNFAYWARSTLPPPSESMLQISADTTLNSSLFDDLDFSHPWPQEGLW